MWTYMKKGRRTFEEKVKSTRLFLSHEGKGLVASSESRPWVGCLTLSLRSYSQGTASERDRQTEREMADSLSRTQWPGAGSPSHLLAFLSAVPLIIGENL